MASLINNSNSSSALISTILASEGSLRNDFIYEETAKVVPPHSFTVQTIVATSGTVGANQSVNFDLAKQGLLTRLLANITFDHDSTDFTGRTPTNFLHMIESVELLTSGRRICIITANDILAIMSDMPYHVRRAYQEAYKMGETGTGTGFVSSGGATGVMGERRVVVPLDLFFTEDVKLAINSNFEEPHRVVIKFSDCKQYFKTNTLTAMPPTSCELLAEYREPPNKLFDEIVEENYDSGLLSKLITSYTSNPVKTITLDDTNASSSGFTARDTTTIDLKETACVEAIYVMAYCPASSFTTQAEGAVGANVCLELDQVRLSANGMDIMNVPAEMLQYWGRRENSKHRYSSAGISEDNTVGLEHVYKIDFGYTSEGVSNLLSMRELNNPQLHLTFAKRGKASPFTDDSRNGKSCNIHVQYATKQLLTIQASNGRANLSLNN